MTEIDPNLIFQEPPAETPDLRFGFANQAAPNDANLIFQDSPATSPDLVFGGGSFTAPRRQVNIAATVRGGVTVNALCSQPIRAYAAVLVGGVTVRAGAYYDIRVTPYLDARYLSGQQAAISRTSDNGGDWGVSKPSERQTDPAWELAKFNALENGESTKASLPIVSETDVLHTLGDGRTAATDTSMDIAKFVDTGRSSKYTTADPQRAFTSSGMQAGIFKVQSREDDWQGGVPRQTIRSGSIGKGVTNQGFNGLVSGWILAGRGKAGASKPPEPPKPPVPIKLPEVVTTHLLFQHPAPTNARLLFGGVYIEPDKPQSTLYILPARFYMTSHTIIAQRLPDLAELPIFEATVSADSGSFCWSLSANGHASLFDLLAPVNGLPARVKLTLDGIPWVFAVDSLSRNSGFGKTGVSLSGRSVTSLISAPYMRVATRNNAGGARTAQQLAAEALNLTGVTLDWGITDWLVPTNAWNHQGTPLDAVQTIVQAAGGYVQSHRSDAKLLARHPYGARIGDAAGAPWGWMQGAADVELAPDAIITDSVERKDGADINGVYVSGTTQGVLGLVKRTGTAADKLAAMVTDPLITDVVAARQRGLSILGAAGAKYNVQLDLPVLTGANQPAVLEVGQLVQVNTATPWRGRVRAVSVSAKRPSLRQSVTLERHLEAA